MNTHALGFGPEPRVGAAISFFWLAYLVLVPFCLFSSGLPQPADMMLALAVLYTIAKGHLKFSRDQTSVLTVLSTFVAYVFVVNTIWAILIGDFGFSPKSSTLFKSAFYTFNGFVFLTAMVIAARSRDEFLDLTFKGLTISVLLQVLLLPISMGPASRQELFFNNPNQLGYYALVAATLIFVISQVIRTNSLLRVAGFVACLMLAALSLSKAAMLGIAILMFFGMVQKPLAVLPPMLLLAALVYLTPAGHQQLDLLEVRLSTVGDSADDSLEQRGYDRILNHPSYWAFGAGEGAYERFETVLADGEIHSTWASTFFSYGVVGTALFLAFLYMVLRNKPSFVIYSFLPIVFYGITHNGSRESLLWIYLALIASLSGVAARSHEAAATSGAEGRRTGPRRMRDRDALSQTPPR